MNNIKMHESPVVIYCICQIRELYQEQTRTAAFFKKKRSVVCWPYFSVLSLLCTDCVISSNCFLCFRTKTVIMTWWVLFYDCAWSRLAGAGALTFVFSQAQTWPGNSCVTSQPWSEQRRDEEWSVNLKTDFTPWLSVEGSEGSLLLVLSALRWVSCSGCRGQCLLSMIRTRSMSPDIFTS